MDSTLLQDLTEYKGSKDKGVMMAARSLIGLYRDVAPEMLQRKDRGKAASMGMKERVALRYGEEKVGEIEGLELLEKWKEEQKALKRAERGDDGGEYDGEDDEKEEEEAWDNWEVESDEESDDETGWINVESDDEIEISDSEDEKMTPKKRKVEDEDKEEDKEEEAAKEIIKEEKKLSKLATTRILTPADLAKLEELKTQAGLEKLVGKKQQKNEDAVDLDLIEGGTKRGKSEKEARLAAVMEGREDRKYGSKRGQKLNEKAHSTTNKEKARKKNFLMTLGKAKGKQKMSLMDTRRSLKAGAERAKKNYKR